MDVKHKYVSRVVAIEPIVRNWKFHWLIQIRETQFRIKLAYIPCDMRGTFAVSALRLTSTVPNSSCRKGVHTVEQVASVIVVFLASRASRLNIQSLRVLGNPM